MSCEVITLFAGAAAPEYLSITIVRDPDDADPPDFTTCTAASLLVRADACTVQTWPLVIVATTPTSLIVKHVFAADGSDLRKPGLRRMQVLYTLPAGVRRTEPFEVNAVAAP